MAAESTANAVWEGDLAHGGGRVAPGSGAFPEQEATWASRTSRSAGKTSPEELIAAAHAACYAMAFSHTLAEGGHAPERVEVSATATFETEGGGPRISTMALVVRGRVPGIEESAFQEAANAAKDGCPVSGALKGNVEITLDATLES
jgi:osmotically inducible protein OsmC